VMKRWRARARGRVARIKKPTCHITVKLVPGPDTARVPPPAPAPTPAPEPEATEPAAAEEKPAPKKRAAAKPKATAEETAEKKPAPKRAPRKKKEEDS